MNLYIKVVDGITNYLMFSANNSECTGAPLIMNPECLFSVVAYLLYFLHVLAFVRLDFVESLIAFLVWTRLEVRKEKQLSSLYLITALMSFQEEFACMQNTTCLENNTTTTPLERIKVSCRIRIQTQKNLVYDALRYFQFVIHHGKGKFLFPFFQLDEFEFKTCYSFYRYLSFWLSCAD